MSQPYNLDPPLVVQGAVAVPVWALALASVPFFELGKQKGLGVVVPESTENLTPQAPEIHHSKQSKGSSNCKQEIQNEAIRNLG